MNTAIAITAIVATMLLANSIVTAIRDTAQAKLKANTRHCTGCTCTDRKENNA